MTVRLAIILVTAAIVAIAADKPVPADITAKYWFVFAKNQQSSAAFFASLSSEQRKMMEEMQATSKTMQSVRAQIDQSCPGGRVHEDAAGQSEVMTCSTPGSEGKAAPVR